MPPVATMGKYLELNSWATFCAAWHTVTLAPLERRADRRGADTLIPGAAGVIANPRRPTFSERTLPMKFFGDFTPEGTPIDDPAVGLETNLELFQAQIVDAGLDLIPAVIHYWGGGTKTADVHVEDFDWTEDDVGVAVATLVLSIPDGAFA